MKRTIKLLSLALALILTLVLLPATPASAAEMKTTQTIADNYYIKSDGSLWTRDNNSDGMTAPKFGEEYKLMDSVASISSGDGVIYAIKTDKSLWSICSHNSYTPMLGYEKSVFPGKNIPVKILDNVIKVGEGFAVTANNELYYFGNSDGSYWTWTGTNTGSPTPVKILTGRVADVFGTGNYMLTTEGYVMYYGSAGTKMTGIRGAGLDGDDTHLEPIRI